MKTVSIFLLLLMPHLLSAQDVERMGNICLNPYVPEDIQMDTQPRHLLMDKLSQIATANGVAGSGIDNRFVITANIRELSKTVTETVPEKTVIRLSVSFYVGDGIDGTLFSSANKELIGIGSNEADAYRAAIRKITVRDRLLIDCVNEGKSRILSYYDQMAGKIIAAARSAVSSGDYDGAINMLFVIPMQCKAYQQAQSLIADYSQQQIENRNQTLLAEAQATWGSSPNRSGASKTQAILNGIQYPSAKVIAEVNRLCHEMSGRLQEIDNQEWQREMKEMQNKHSREMARIQNEKERSIAYINAAASVARVWAANRPKVVYRIYHWW